MQRIGGDAAEGGCGQPRVGGRPGAAAILAAGEAIAVAPGEDGERTAIAPGMDRPNALIREAERLDRAIAQPINAAGGADIGIEHRTLLSRKGMRDSDHPDASSDRGQCRNDTARLPPLQTPARGGCVAKLIAIARSGIGGGRLEACRVQAGSLPPPDQSAHRVTGFATIPRGEHRASHHLPMSRTGFRAVYGALNM